MGQRVPNGGVPAININFLRAALKKKMERWGENSPGREMASCSDNFPLVYY